MKNSFKIKGTFIFDPPDVTEKHKKQGAWKKVALIQFTGQHCDYYRWFIKKRFNLILGTPIRGPHVTFINDSHRDMGDGINKWEVIKKKLGGKTIEVEFNVDPQTDGINWWLRVSQISRDEIQVIRNELGLGKPYFGLHMTIGVARDAKDDDPYVNNETIRPVRKNEEHSKYIQLLMNKKLV